MTLTETLYRPILATLLALTISVAAYTPNADAKRRSYAGDAKFSLGLQLGLGGEGLPEDDAPGEYAEQDMEPTVGLALSGTYPLHRYFHIGLGLGLEWWQVEAGDDAKFDRNLAIDIVALLKIRLPMLRDKLEIYLTAPIGVSISALSDDYERYIGVDGGVGVAFGLRAGLGYTFYDALGAYFEIGWTGKHHGHEFTGTSNDFSFTFHQFAMNLGVNYAF